MGEVPVVLFVFNRPDHLPDVLAQLRMNTIPKLYVFCDGSRGPEDDMGVAQVRELIHNIDWVDKEVFESAQNKGLSESIISGLSRLFELHERLIIIEDDIVVAPGFYNYMTKTLEYYKNKHEVAGVTGLCYPVGDAAFSKYPYDTYFQKRFCSWGWGTWRRAWKKFDFNAASLAKEYEPIHEQTAGIAGQDMAMMAPMSLSGELGGSWDVQIGINMLIQDKYFVWPTRNLVENHGIGTGTHKAGKPPWKLIWSEGFSGNINYAPFGYEDKNLTRRFIHFFNLRKRPNRIQKLVTLSHRAAQQVIRGTVPYLQPHADTLSKLSKSPRYQHNLQRFGVVNPRAMNDTISENLEEFRNTIKSYKLTSTTRPDSFDSSFEVLIPCYNHALYLEDAFKSIEWQTYLPKGLTVTFINDRSTDDSLAVMKRIQHTSKTIKVKIVNNRTNLDQDGSLNRAIRKSKSQLLMNLNADDMLVEDCFEKVLRTYKENPDIFLLGGSSLWFATNEPRPDHTISSYEHLHLTKYGPADSLYFTEPNSINMSHSSLSFTRSAWELVGGYRPRGSSRTVYNDDRDFEMRVCSLLPIAIYSDYPLQYYRTDTSTRHRRGNK